MAGSEHAPNTPELGILGDLLRAARNAAGATTRQVEGFSSGHVSNVENGRVMPSRKFVLLYVNRFGCDRRRVMVAYRRAVDAGRARRERRFHWETSEAEQDPVTKDSPIDHIRDTYRTEEVETTYRVGAQGQIEEVVTIRSISAAVPGVSLVVARFAYPTDPNQGVLSMRAGSGCSKVRTEESPTGAVTSVFSLDRELDPGDDPYVMSFRVKSATHVPAKPKVRYYASTRTHRCSVRVQFSEMRSPLAVWWFRAKTVVEVEYESPTEERFIDGDGGGLYFRDFFDLDDEYCGIAWRWRSG
ncbi:helix-turn-helix domain-containing protein [Nocardiopsis halophila]|uniref:helix-turn-helix domain-containing protein n=1 Tax=Nocardiopsis halophila TaxID=141692 RepID=UPI0003774F70|nr:helix-turn-helix transcriptional regulator [Nocardiopsis halophila]